MNMITSRSIFETCHRQALKCWGFCFLFIGSGAFNLIAGLPVATLFKGPLVAQNAITLNGTVRIDSFDSSNPLYSTNGQYAADKAKDGGSIGSLASNTVNAISLGGSVDVFGHVYAGPGDTVKLVGGAQVGSTAWINGGNTGVEPNHSHSDLFFTIPPIPQPLTSGQIPLPSKTSNAFQGTTYTNSYLLTTGKYVSNYALSLSGTDAILISGNVTLYTANSLKLFISSRIIIGTNSSLTIFAAANLDFGGGGIVNNTGFVTNLTIYSLTNSQVSYNGDSVFIGSICTPTSDVKLSGSFALIGSVVANSITVSAASLSIHYDESAPSPLLQVTPLSVLHSLGFGPNGVPRFRVAGVQGYPYVIETSPNLTDWSRIFTNSAPFTFTSATPISTPQFFRAVALP